MSGIDEILATYEGLRADQEAFYQDPNRHTGLSPAEHRTARRIAGRLHRDGFTVTSGIGGKRVVGVLAAVGIAKLMAGHRDRRNGVLTNGALTLQADRRITIGA